MLTEDQQKANRYALAHRDMKEVLKYLDAYDELQAVQTAFGDSRYYDHCEAILIASVITYCRSFMRSKSNGHATTVLDEADFDFLSNDPELASLHSQLLVKRNKSIAHADWEEHNTHRMDCGGQTGILRRMSAPDYVSHVDTVLFRQLADQVRKACLVITHDLDIESSQTG